MKTNKTTVKGLLTKKRFREWLDSQDLWAIVGAGESYNCCPIANFLKHEGLDVEGVLCGLTRFRDFDIHNPKWARMFVRRVDRQFPCYRNVHADQALEILDSK